MGIGWNLVSLNTPGEQDYILGLLKERPDFELLWSLHVGPFNKNGIWFEGTLDDAKQINYTIRWHEGEPNDFYEIEKCMVIMKNSDGIVDMYDMTCNIYIASFICSHIEYL